MTVLLMVGVVSRDLPEACAESVLPPPPLSAMPITLAWSPANDPSVAGYAIYYGRMNQSTLNRIDAGNHFSATIFGMEANAVYRLYAVSYNAAGLESTPSNEVLFSPPAISPVQLSPKSDGSMRLSGKAAPGTACTVLFTPTLESANWQPLAHTTADQVGNIIYQDMSASQAGSRFYRLAMGVLPLVGELQIQPLSGGSIRLEGSAPPGNLCTVLFTPTLERPVWQPLAYATADQAGKVIVEDASARQAKSRFYRLALGALPILGDLKIQLQSGGNVLLASKAPPGASCRVLYAATPGDSSWQTLKTVTADSGGNVTALDTTAGQAATRFYRMAMP